jgi:DNA-binding NarL/FixJ family response regulator
VRILIVDDHVRIRAEVRCLLETEHWNVCGEAVNGWDALEKVRRLKPDLVILDFSMPVVSGYEAAREIRRISPATRILILSMHEPANLPSILKETEADAYVTKSRTVRELVSTIKQLWSASAN